jgi:hypothetical protein
MRAEGSSWRIAASPGRSRSSRRKFPALPARDRFEAQYRHSLMPRHTSPRVLAPWRPRVRPCLAGIPVCGARRQRGLWFKNLSSLAYPFSDDPFERVQCNATGVVIIVTPHRYPGAVFGWIATAATLCHPPAGQDRIRKRGFLLLCYAVHPP